MLECSIAKLSVNCGGIFPTHYSLNLGKSPMRTYPLPVESRPVVVNVLHDDLEQARGLLGRRPQVGGGQDQRVFLPLFSVQPNLNVNYDFRD